MKQWFFFFVALAAGFYWLDRQPGFSDNGLREDIDNSVLGKPPYQNETCLRNYYESKVEMPYGHDDKDVVIFVYHPVNGHAKDCPAVQVMASKYTGEVWVDVLGEK